MNFNIEILAIFILVILYFAYEIFKNRKLWSKKKTIYWGITRFLIIILLLLSVTNFGLNLKNRDTTTIFLVDKSLSTNKYEKEIEEYINYQIDYKRKGDKVAVLAFGGDTAIELPLTNKKDKVKFSTNINRNFTDIEKAVDFSINYFPKNNNRRLVIITDKKENSGDIQNIKNRIKKESINLMIKEVKSGSEQDVQIEKVIVPKNIYKNGNIATKVKLYSNYNDKGSLHIYLNDKKILKKSIEVKEGENEVELNLPIKDENKILLKAEIDFPKDKNTLNNVYTLERNISKDPKILLIGNKNEELENVHRLLKNLNINSQKYFSNEVPGDINFLSDFNEIILVNTDYKGLPKNFDNNLEKVVKEFGSGLMVIGGENSFALGDYKNTKLEELLPVSCNMKNKRKQGDVGIILLIDCSGSMEDESEGVKKIELAKQGAIETIKALELEDYIGVLGFSDTIDWVVPFQKVEDKEKLIKEVGKLKPKGGTLIIPGLIEGVKTLSSAKTKVKHMILLTDGQAEKNGFDKYLENMKKSNITLSTVGIGGDSDKEVLSYLSDSSGGRKYFSSDFKSVPRIFAKETKISQKKYINNEVFTPKEIQNDFNKEGNTLPQLRGYMGTGIKKGANLILESPKEDPILVTWNYGIGKVGVWTSDLDGKWSRDWIAWDGFEKYWSSIINYLLKDNKGELIDVEINRIAGNVQIFAGIKKDIKNGDLQCIVIGPNNKEEKITMQLEEKNNLKGKFSLKDVGKYKFFVTLKEGEQVLDKVEQSVYLDYFPEYAIQNNDYNLDEVLLECNGKYLHGNENVFKEDVVNKNISYIDLNFILLPLAFLIFLVDIFLRINY
ncbi:VWA domain-containing protein [Clostridium cochlearium]|uniref:VWA domain-containing protein n=1 Tax=Clostridium cochlearium TaxID=1494 RepID=A0A7Y3XWJ0_CLOCO|nr:VWA domain-containing protein [Clostridium cochlearium]NOH15844.1 VWA domain-containing protein [Clostridium cochlearium]